MPSAPPRPPDPHRRECPRTRNPRGAGLAPPARQPRRHTAHRLWRHAGRELYDDVTRYVWQLRLVVAAVMTGANDIGCVGRARARGEQRLLTGALLCLQPHHDALDGKAQGDAKRPCRKSGAPHAGTNGIESRASSWMMREVATRAGVRSDTLSTDDARNRRAVQIATCKPRALQRPGHHSRGADVCPAACHNAAVLPLRTIRVTRYVTPLREGGSLPAIVEADDDGLYVVKFRGAGQGPQALVAELISGEIARALGLAGAGVGLRRTRSRPRPDRTRPRDPRANPRQRRPEPRHRLSARVGHLRSGRPAATGRSRLAHRLVRCLCQQCRPNRPGTRTCWCGIAASG